MLTSSISRFNADPSIVLLRYNSRAARGFSVTPPDCGVTPEDALGLVLPNLQTTAQILGATQKSLTTAFAYARKHEWCVAVYGGYSFAFVEDLKQYPEFVPIFDDNDRRVKTGARTSYKDWRELVRLPGARVWRIRYYKTAKPDEYVERQDDGSFKIYVGQTPAQARAPQEVQS
jgi:hypothetical protein